MTLAENLIREFKKSEKKSFSREEVVDIIKNITSSHQENDLESNGIIISPKRHLIYVNGKEMIIPRKAFALLYYFIENKNKKLIREQILRDIWGSDVCVVDSTITVHVNKIRALGIPYIKTLTKAYIWQEK